MPCLSLSATTAEGAAHSLVRELRSPTPRGVARNQQKTATQTGTQHAMEKLQTCLKSTFLGGRRELGSRGRDMRIPTAASC